MIDKEMQKKAFNPPHKGEKAPREKIIKLGKKITDVIVHKITGITSEDPEYWGLASLVSDEMAEKVRAAFDAYIFLSYRKKDRKYANELMRLIHKNDFCRDIAIWYDEYLVPGEDFNNAITEALKRVIFLQWW